ncbi:hypothetical protein CEXT_184121 [Caerostris extrusa]|uniref:Uncharacterized protein n=1 Tax=Caerostris extrusa TaxID=172846 RepID=A0AAV4S0N4_CAEEX|nr:hypothetical protein CEXT_184121 [Caerostris extrusa]
MAVDNIFIILHRYFLCVLETDDLSQVLPSGVESCHILQTIDVNDSLFVLCVTYRVLHACKYLDKWQNELLDQNFSTYKIKRLYLKAGFVWSVLAMGEDLCFPTSLHPLYIL